MRWVAAIVVAAAMMFAAAELADGTVASYRTDIEADIRPEPEVTTTLPLRERVRTRAATPDECEHGGVVTFDPTDRRPVFTSCYDLVVSANS